MHQQGPGGGGPLVHLHEIFVAVLWSRQAELREAEPDSISCNIGKFLEEQKQYELYVQYIVRNN